MKEGREGSRKTTEDKKEGREEGNSRTEGR